MTLTVYETLEQGNQTRKRQAPVRNFAEPYLVRAKRRFSKFVPSASADECWEWQSVRNRRGYGKFWFYGRTDLAHRVSYELFRGPIPEGQVVRHACDNPPCVNPAHLSAGTLKDNARDALDRGRYPRGETQGRAKLTTEQVDDARRSVRAGETQRSVAARLGVAPSTIWWIVSGRRWIGIGEEE